MPGPPPEQFRRIARWPSRYAPRLSELHSPPVDPEASLDSVADLSGVLRNAEGEITGATMSARVFVHLAGRCPTLTHVRLIGAAMIFDEVLRTPHLNSLRTLNLNGCQIGDAGAEHLAREATFSRLQQLDLGDNGLTPHGLTAVAAAPWATHLNTLSIGTSQYDDAIDAFGHVESFDLTNCVMSRDPWGQLVTPQRQFDSLELANTGLYRADFTQLVQCRRLGLARNALGDDRVQQLTQSGTLARVTHLDLGVNRLTRRTMLALAYQVPNLVWLNVRGNFLTGDDLALLTEREAFPHLRQVETGLLR